MKTRIFFVDDEPANFDHYKNCLAGRENQWDVSYFADALEALAALKETPPDIVIADYEMPGMTGPNFLKQVETLLPAAERYITAAPEQKALLEADIGSDFHYLPKPCEKQRLVTEIQRCIAIDVWLGNDKVKSIVAKMGSFPSLPPMYVKVVNALNSRNTSVADIGQAISGDLAISAKVLQVVNSSFYGYDEKISDITHAVQILGLDCVKNLVLAIQVFGKSGHSPDQKALTDQLWHHSMSVAVAAKRIMEYETRENPEKAGEEAYTAGLMHDIGKLVMINSIPEEYEKARTLSREKGIPQWKAEEEVIGCNHAEAGAYLLGRWGMPAPLVEAVALHHEPVNSSGSKFSPLAAVHAANALVRERQPGEKTHPDALADEEFLSEIGKAGSWELWQEVVTGKTPPRKPAPQAATAAAKTQPKAASPQPAASESKKAASPPSNSPARPSAAASPAAPASEQEANSNPEQKKSPKTGLILAALAAAAVIGIFLFPKSEAPAPAAADEPFAMSPLPPQESETETSPAPANDLASPEKTVLDNVSEADAATEAANEIIAEAAETASDPIPPETIDDALAIADAPSAAVATETAPALPPEPEDSFPRITLGGIFYNETAPAASINGKIVRAGAMVSGAKVIVIEQKRVVLSYEGETRSFVLNK